MHKIAQFFKVSENQFKTDWQTAFGDMPSNIKDIYNSIEIPRRATMQSAGYDFFAPCDITLDAGESIKIPTGICTQINDGWLLQIYPRSGLGFKFRLQLDNTVGIIDGDYYNSENEGHIQIKITNDSKEKKQLYVKAGDAFSQGVFAQFGITIDDDCMGVRNGGFGSTTNAN